METFDCICTRRSIKRFSRKGVEREKIGKILEAARWAPSPGNVQSWEFIVVEDPEKKSKLVDIASNRHYIEEAPVSIVVLTDRSRMERRFGERGKGLYCIQETAACMQNMLLEAHDQGLGACWVGDFREEPLKDLFNIPERLKPVAIITIGYAKETPRTPNKFRVTDVTYLNEYDIRISPFYDKIEWKGLKEYTKQAKKSLSEGLSYLKEKFGE